MGALNQQALDQLFTEARSFNDWKDQPVADELLRDLYDLMKAFKTKAAIPADFDEEVAEIMGQIGKRATPGNLPRMKAYLNKRKASSEKFSKKNIVPKKEVRPRSPQSRNRIRIAAVPNPSQK